MKRTPFGTMLSNFRYQKQMAIAKVKRELLEKHKADNPKDRDNYEFRETTVNAQDGSTVTKVELWKRLDSERVKITTSVNSETLTDEKVEEQKDNDDWLK